MAERGHNRRMHGATTPFRSLFLAMATALAAAGSARAALGEQESRLSQDAGALRASHALMPRGAYTVHELATPEGVRVREFSVPGGAVFAVGWSGPFRPDLRALLGANYGTYLAAPRLPGSTRSQVAIDHQGLRVRAGGHMHAFRGIAWLPALMPAGVGPGDLQ